MYDYENFPPDFFLCSNVRTNVSYTKCYNIVNGSVTVYVTAYQPRRG